MIYISMTTADARGSVAIKDGSSDLSTVVSRVSRKATLDGGATIVNYGVSHGDRTFRIRSKINVKQREALTYIRSNALSVVVSCVEGLFVGAIESMDAGTPNLEMTILIKSKEA